MEADTAGEQLVKAVEAAQSLTAIPLLKLLKFQLGIDLFNKLGIDKNAKQGNITIMSKDNKEVEVSIDIVGEEFNIMNSFNECNIYKKKINTFLDIEEEPIREQTIELISYLMKCCLLTFNNLKNGELRYNISEYQLETTIDTKLMILSDLEDKECERKYLSVVFKLL